MVDAAAHTHGKLVVRSLRWDRGPGAQVRVDLLAAGVQPALWSAEAPNLYVLVLTLLGRDDAHIESESCQARCCCATKP